MSTLTERVIIIEDKPEALPMYGNLHRCGKCKREILVEEALIGVSHTVATIVTCWDCLTDEQKAKARELYKLGGQREKEGGFGMSRDSKQQDDHGGEEREVEWRGTTGQVPVDRRTGQPLCPKCGGLTDLAGEWCLGCLL